MREKSYLIPLKPISWKRVGLAGTRFYDQQVKEKIAYGLYLLKSHGDADMFVAPVEIDVTFYMTTAQKRIAQIKKYHASTPDLDNLIKLLLDAIVETKSIVSDDKIIASINAKKVYDSKPRTEFIIRELE